MERPMTVIQVNNSKAIQTIIYNQEKSQMMIKFADSPLYTYDNVEKDLFEAFSQAESKGSFYHKQIKPFFTPTQRLDN